MGSVDLGSQIGSWEFRQQISLEWSSDFSASDGSACCSITVIFGIISTVREFV